MDCNTKYCSNGNIPQTDVQIQHLILTKISADFHIEICKLILKLAWKFKVA